MPDNSNAAITDFSQMSFDDVFDVTSETIAPEPQAPPSTPTAPQVPETPAPQEPFLQTQTGTVYKSKEEAERGYAEKDRVIEQLRAQQIALTGYDPITGKPVQMAPRPQNTNYAADADQFYKDLAEATSANGGKGDPRRFSQVMGKWQQDILAPYMPVIAQSAKTSALQELDKTVKIEGGFAQYMDSSQYKQYISERPILAQAIQTVEANPAAVGQLKDLLLLAYEGSNGRNIAQIMAQNRTQSGPTPNAPRPTLSPTTPNAPNYSSEPASLSTAEGRKQIIAQGRARGLDKLMGNSVFGS